MWIDERAERLMLSDEFKTLASVGYVGSERCKENLTAA